MLACAGYQGRHFNSASSIGHQVAEWSPACAVDSFSNPRESALVHLGPARANGVSGEYS
jgi:hypothetical protein